MKKENYLAERKLTTFISRDLNFKKKYNIVKKYAEERGVKLFAVINEVFDFYIENVIKKED